MVKRLNFNQFCIKYFRPQNVIERMTSLMGCILLGLIYFISGLSAAEPQTSPGSIPGKFSVSSGGAATYQIPLEIPPGIQRVQPKLGLSYSSQAQNSTLGFGWSLTGLPFIERCGQTIATDNVTTGVSYTDSDRFCLGGQRLINVSNIDPNQPYYSDSANFHTEIEIWANVVGHNNNGKECGSGPCKFIAKTSSGATLEFGASESSQILAIDPLGASTFSSGDKKGSVRIWALNKYTDTNGNSFNIHYTTAPQTLDGLPIVSADNTGAFYVTRIDYTENKIASVASKRSVQFFYEGRDDKSASFQGGAMIEIAARLHSIQTCLSTQGSIVGIACENAEIVSKYEFEYCDSIATDCTYISTTDRSVLYSITQCSGANTCLPPTVLNWQEGQNTTSFINDTQTGLLDTLYATCDQANGQLSWADFDGNGLQDFICNNTYAQPSIGSVFILLNDGSQLSPPNGAPATGLINQNANCMNGTAVWTDLNGDSLVDWLCNETTTTGKFKALLSNGVSLESPSGNQSGEVEGTRALCQAPSTMLWADFNGDGRSDWICADSKAGNFSVMLSTGTNLVSINDPNSHNSATARLNYNNSASCSETNYVNWTDFNGDGMVDWICNNPTQAQTFVFLSTGSTIQPANSSNQNGLLNNTNGICPEVQTGNAVRLWQDFNGDKLADWICNDFGGTGSLKVLLSTGIDLSSASSNSSGLIPIANQALARCKASNSTKRIALTDFNGDEIPDWICNDLTLGSAEVLISTGNSLYPIENTITIPQCVSNAPVIKRFEWFDFNGDGLSDAVCNERQSINPVTGRVWVALHNPAMPDLITEIENGVGGKTEISYQPLTNPSVYTRTVSEYPLGQMLGYPDIIAEIPNYVTSTYSLSNNASINSKAYNYTYSYHYEGGMIGLDGRGWLGFARTTLNDPQIQTPETPNGTRLTTRFSQIYPFVGQTLAKKYCDNDAQTDSCTEQSHQYMDYKAKFLCEDPQAANCVNNKTFKPYAKIYQVLKTEEWQKNHSFGSKLKKTYAFNTYGQVTRYSDLGDVGNNQSNPIYTCSNYLNDTSNQQNWHIGFLTDQKQSSSSDCPSTQAQWNNYTFDDDTDLSWKHISYDDNLNVISSVKWDDENNSWLGRGFVYGNKLGNRSQINKQVGQTISALNTVPNSTYNIEFDQTFQSFPSTFTTPATVPDQPNTKLSVQFAFDARFGKRVGLVDLNNHVRTTCLDDFGNKIATQGPMEDGGEGVDTNCLGGTVYNYLPQAFSSAEVATLTKTNVIHKDGNKIAVETQQRQSWDKAWADTEKLTATNFYDGLFRNYKQITPGDNNTNIISLTEYYGQKKIARSSLPFFAGTASNDIQWTSNTYDVYGRPIARTSPYDGTQVPISAQSPCTNADPATTTTTCFTYAKPNTVTVTKAANTTIADERQVQFSYFNSKKRPVTMITDGTTAYGFNLLGKPISIVDAGGVRSEIRYDSLGRRTFLGEIDLGPRVFEYDNIGRLTQRNDGLETRVELSYDGLNRVLSKSYFAKNTQKPAQKIEFTYDMSQSGNLENVIGRKASASLIDLVNSENSSTYQFGYDPYGRGNAQNLLFEGNTYSASHEFSPSGKLTQTSLPDPQQTNLTLNHGENGLLSDITLEDISSTAPETYLELGAFNALGQPGQQTFKNGVVENYDYTASGVLKTHTITPAPNATNDEIDYLLSEAFEWNPLGLVTAIIDCNYNDNNNARCDGISGSFDTSDNSQSFSYTFNRLTEASGLYGETNYEYAPGGNLIVKDDVEYTYASQKTDRENEPSHQVASSSDGLQTSYDNNGNMIQKTTSSGTWTFEYDLLNKMVSAELDETRTNDFVYDFSGRRLKKTTYVPGSETVANTVYYITPLFEFTTFGNNQENAQYTRYVPGLTGKAISITNAMSQNADIDPAQGIPLPGTSLTMHRNSVASTSIVTDSDGAFYSQVNYTPYGSIYNIVPGPSTNHYRSKFNGHELDEGTEIYDFNARYYDQSIMRFSSADTQLGANPLAQDAFNRYEINLSNPISLTDPTGNAACNSQSILIKVTAASAVSGAALTAIGGTVVGGIAGGGAGAGEGFVGGAASGVLAGAAIGLTGCAVSHAIDSSNSTTKLTKDNHEDVKKIADQQHKDHEATNKILEENNKLIKQQNDLIKENNELIKNKGDDVTVNNNYSQTNIRNDFTQNNTEINQPNIEADQIHVDHCDLKSFTPNTLVLDDSGNLLDISSLYAGQQLLGYDEEAKNVGAFKITKQFSRKASEFYKIRVEDEFINVTHGHRFKILNGDWVAVENLQSGDLIQDINGNGREFISRERVNKQTTVYNMSVASVHNYFITKLGLLVHNANCEQPDELTDSSDVSEFSADASDIAELAEGGGEAAADLSEATSVVAEGSTLAAEAAGAIAGMVEATADVVEGAIIACAALCWL